MIFDHKRKIMYCPIEKVGCTTWKAVMVNNSDSRKKESFQTLLSPEYIHATLPQFNGVERAFYVEAKHKNYKKFMFVRNPFERLASAYFNKAFPTVAWDGKSRDYYYAQIQKFTLNNFQHENITASVRKHYNATFREFVAYILKHNDVHWDSMQRFCDPCNIKYDYILRMETMQRDSQALMRDLYPKAGPLPVANAAMKKDKSDQTSTWVKPKVLGLFSQISEDLMDKLYKKYTFDLEFYGYSFNRNNFSATCNGWGQKCC